MNKNVIGLILLIILGVVAYFMIADEPIAIKSTKDFKDFAIEDTASIDKIFISQPNGKKVLLSRNEKGVWIVNNQFPARIDAINLILKTVNDIKIRGPVSKTSFESVVKRLATGSTKVEYYQDTKKPTKTWYIGDATAGRMGTYMLLEKDGEKSSKPYVTHRLMEKGFLGSRFFLDPHLWKDPAMMKSNPKTINSVRVVNSADTITSFELVKTAPTKFELTNLDTKETVDVPADYAVLYLKEFDGVFYEYVDLKTPQEELDSIYNSTPRSEMTIKLEGGKTIEMRTYYLPVIAGSELYGKPIYFHPERMYAFSSELGKDLHPIVQNLTFDKLTMSIYDFKSSTTVEK